MILKLAKKFLTVRFSSSKVRPAQSYTAQEVHNPKQHHYMTATLT